MVGAPGLTRTGTSSRTTDFESVASTNSATGANSISFYKKAETANSYLRITPLVWALHHLGFSHHLAGLAFHTTPPGFFTPAHFSLLPLSLPRITKLEIWDDNQIRPDVNRFAASLRHQSNRFTNLMPFL